MSEKEEKPKTMKLSILISVALSISIIIIILYFTIDTETIQHLTSHNIKYEFFIVAILVNIFYWILWGARLKILSNAIDKNVKIDLWESTKIIITNLFLANITPSMAGGEPVRIYLLKNNGLSIGGATAAVLGERLLDAIFLILCFPFAFYVFRRHIETGPLAIALTICEAMNTSKGSPSKITILSSILIFMLNSFCIFAFVSPSFPIKTDNLFLGIFISSSIKISKEYGF